MNKLHSDSTAYLLQGKNDVVRREEVSVTLKFFFSLSICHVVVFNFLGGVLKRKIKLKPS